MMKTLVVAATAMVLAAPAFAQTPSAPPASPPADTAKPVDVFAKADGNKDGALTIAEVKLADPAVTQADFDKADSDKSKSLSKTEFDKWAMAKPADKASAPGQ